MNTQLHQSSWLWGALAPASVVVLVDAFVASRIEQADWAKGVGRTMFVAALALGLMGAMGWAPVMGAAAFVAVMLIRSVVLAKGSPRRASSIRLVCVGVALIVCATLARPAQRSTDELVSLLTATPYVFDDNTWALTELKRRADGLSELQSNVQSGSKGESERVALVRLELHQRLGAPAGERSPGCALLLKEPNHFDDSWAARLHTLCGEAQQPSK